MNGLRRFASTIRGQEQYAAPLIIFDDITATSVRLYWSDVYADSYKLYKDNIEVYSGSALSFNVTTGIAQGESYNFRVESLKSGFKKGVSENLEVNIPNFYPFAEFLPGRADTPARQTALEPSSGGVDRAMSWSFWFRIGRIMTHNLTQMLVHNTGTQIQMAISRVSSSNQTPTTCERLRFELINGSNIIGIQSTQKILINRMYHVVCTYTGSETVGGMKMYINGVEESTVDVSTGSYTGAYDNSSIRTRVGSGGVTSRQYIGSYRDLAIFDATLTSDDVDELYNGGIPIDIDGMSVYSDIIAYWPFRSNANCLNNSTFNFTGSSINYSSTRTIGLQVNSINRAESGNTRQVAFGGGYFDSDNKIKWYGRSGTSHTAGGRIQKITYDPSNRSVVVVDPVITDGTYSMSGVSAARILDSVRVFSTRYQVSGDTFIDSRMYTSSDGTTGEAFDSGEVFDPNYTRFEFYGRPTNANGIWAVPYYGHNGSGTWRVSVFVSDDDGTTWSKFTVVDGSTHYGESAIAFSKGKWIMLIRKNTSPFKLFLSYSTDNCETWSTPAETNLGESSGVSNAEIAVTTVGTLHVLFMVRNQSGQMYRLTKHNDIDDIIASPTSFNTPLLMGRSYTTDSYAPLGYPNLIHLGNEDYFIAWSNEFSSSRADMFMGHGKLNLPT